MAMPYFRRISSASISRALNDGNVELAGLDDFGIFSRNRRAGHDDFRAGDVFRSMAFEDGRAQAGQPLGHCRRA